MDNAQSQLVTTTNRRITLERMATARQQANMKTCLSMGAAVINRALTPKSKVHQHLNQMRPKTTTIILLSLHRLDRMLTTPQGQQLPDQLLIRAVMPMQSDTTS